MIPVPIHEAGHAWAYWRFGLSLRYITVRPSTPGLDGVCRPWRPRAVRREHLALIATCGPVAEAMHTQWLNDDEDLDWDDYLAGAVLVGGHDDERRAGGLLDDARAVRWIREELDRDWAGISDLADLLRTEKTIGGRAAFRLLDEVLS